MGKQTIIFNLPILIKNIGTKAPSAWCPYLNKEIKFNFSPLNKDVTFESEESELTIEETSHLFNLSQLTQALHKLLEEKYEEDGYLDEPDSIEKYYYKDTEENGCWFTYTLKLTIKKGYCEAILPPFLLTSAVITQGFSIFSAAVSIYVKGLSIPVTILFASATSASTLINFTQSGTPGMAANVGRYLDHKPLKRTGQACQQLNNKILWSATALISFCIWATTLAANTISTVSETEIIDKAGHDAGWTFLNDDFIFWHATLFAIFGGITVGTFSGNFAIKACQSITQGLMGNNKDYEKGNHEENEKDDSANRYLRIN